MAEYFELLLRVELPMVGLNMGDVMIPAPNSPISKEPASLTEIGDVISKLNDGKACSCSFPVELLTFACSTV